MKLKSLRDQLESFIALKVPNYAENSAFQGSFRVSTAKPYDLNFTYNDFNKKNKEESGKKNISPYYDPKAKLIKRFQRARIPRTACDDRFGKIAENYNNVL